MVMSSSGDQYEDWLEELYQPTDTHTPPVTAEFPVTTSPTTSKGSPKSSLSKPIRRRSRSSKKTPTTILNANANNFRSLVQQFTGRPKSSAAAFPLGAHRGPVNLNFSNYREHTAVAGAAQYSDGGNYIGSPLTFPDRRSLTVTQNSGFYDDQGLGSSGITSSFNNGYSTASNFDGGFVLGSSLTGEISSVVMAPQEEYHDQFPVEELQDLARVSEGLSYTSSRDVYW